MHSTYYCKNPCCSSQFVHLAKQLYPHNLRFAHKAYIDATKRLYKYLLLDLRSEQDVLFVHQLSHAG